MGDARMATRDNKGEVNCVKNSKSISIPSNKISIVMPVYNSENSLNKVIESVLLQTYKNWELVIVDDGSTDGSAEICDYYSKLDQRIKVRHIPNKGVSHARNYGISIASGNLLCFLDSDDRFAPQALSTLNSSIEENDLLVFGYIEVPIQREHCLNKTLVFESIDDFADAFILIDSAHLLNVPWNKCFRMELIKDNDLFFPEDVSMGEDLLFNLNYLEKCNTVKVINKVLYEYDVSSLGSLSKKIQPDTILIQRRLKEYTDSTFKFHPLVEETTGRTFALHIVNDILRLASHGGYKYQEKVGLIKSWLNDDYFYEMFLRYEENMNRNRFILYLIKYKRSYALVVFLSLRGMISRLYHYTIHERLS